MITHANYFFHDYAKLHTLKHLRLDTYRHTHLNYCILRWRARTHTHRWGIGNGAMCPCVQFAEPDFLMCLARRVVGAADRQREIKEGK